MRKFLAALLAACALLCGCSAGADGTAVSIVVTDFPCYDLVRAVKGDADNLTLLIRPGTDAHMYEPAPADAKALYGADLFVYIGGPGDGWAEDILASVDGVCAVRLFDSVEALEEEHGECAGHFDSGDISYDEHIWTSPVNMRAMLESVTEALCAVDPAGADVYRANAASYDAGLAELDAAFRAVVAGAKRTELVFADRFPFLYFAREYGLSYRAAFSGCSDDVQPSVQAVASIIDVVKADDVPVVYVIEMSTRDVARAVAEQTGVEIVEMHSCQNVTQREFEAGENYLSLMKGNVEALKKGLY